MKEKNWQQILNKIEKLHFQEKFDLVVAIARGGIVPGFLIAKKQRAGFEMLWLKFRDDENKVMYKQPRLLKKLDFNCRGKKILLVDDVCRTGATFGAAKKYLKGAKTIKTLAVNGRADYYLYDEECFKFPWS